MKHAGQLLDLGLAGEAAGVEAPPQGRPLKLITMRWTNRPSGIQQVISFSGHR